MIAIDTPWLFELILAKSSANNILLETWTNNFVKNINNFYKSMYESKIMANSKIQDDENYQNN